jgi:hypothetical protein
MPSHTAEMPRPIAPKVRETGPGPLRTARGAGREAGRRLAALEPLRPLVELERGVGLVVRVLRDRVLALDRLFEPDVLVLRDPGGEDVRVAML